MARRPGTPKAEPDATANRSDDARRPRSAAGRASTAAERSWREITGAGHTNLAGPSAARVRETPDFTEAELAQAAREVVVQRRSRNPA